MIIHGSVCATTIVGDCLQSLRSLPAGFVNCCVTSPPYYGLRDYGVDGQIGLEETPEQFIARLVEVFREVRRVLADDGTLWVNIGDSYASRGGQGAQSGNAGRHGLRSCRRASMDGVKEKDLHGIPWMLAFALRADGWYLRQDIVWHKPNPMPESVRDRCTKAHEYVFLLSKSPRYFFDADAVTEPCSPNTHARLSQNVQAQIGSARANGGTRADRPMKAVGRKFDPGAGNKNNASFDAAVAIMPERRNKRSVWTVAPRPYSGAHFAVYPPELIEPCVLAGCPVGGMVLDVFGGSGTTAGVALANGRNAILLELNPEYAALVPQRVASIIARRRAEAA